MKTILLFFSLLFLVGTVQAFSFYDNFHDAEFLLNPHWDANQGTWNAFVGKVNTTSANARLVSATDFNAIDLNFGANFRIKNGTWNLTLADGNSFDVNSMEITAGLAGNIQLVSRINGSGFVIVDTGFPVIANQDYNINAYRSPTGLWQLDVNGTKFNGYIDLNLTHFSDYWVRPTGNSDFNITNIFINDTNIIADIDYNGYTTYLGRNYVNTLTIISNYVCQAGRTANQIISINDVNVLTDALNCNAQKNTLTKNYTHSVDGLIAIKVFNQDITYPNYYLADTNHFFISDIVAPTTDLNVISAGGYSQSGSNITVGLTCTDATSPRANYLIVKNDTNILNAQFDINSLQTVSTSSSSSAIQFNGQCVDLAGNASLLAINNSTVYSACFNLVDEELGVDLVSADLNFFTDLVFTSYKDNNRYDFRANNDTDICFASNGDDTLRLDLNYANSLILFKEFNLKTLRDFNDTDLDVCVADPQDFFQQLFTSSRQRQVIVKHAINGCYSMADYTKYAYQDTLSARAFTITQPYYLYVDNNGLGLLTTVDGGQENSMQLDVLISKAIQYNLQLFPDELSVSLFNTSAINRDSNVLLIDYENKANDNASVQIIIYDVNSIVYNQTITSSPNNFTLYVNLSSFNISQDIQKVVAVKTKSDGTTKTITKYFSFHGGQSIFPPALAAVLAIIFFLFIFTAVGFKSALGWFGIITTIATIGILSLAPGLTWVIYLQAIILIAGIYIFLANDGGA